MPLEPNIEDSSGAVSDAEPAWSCSQSGS